jgi:hypothetical protein
MRTTKSTPEDRRALGRDRNPEPKESKAKQKSKPSSAVYSVRNEIWNGSLLDGLFNNGL